MGGPRAMTGGARRTAVLSAAFGACAASVVAVAAAREASIGRTEDAAAAIAADKADWPAAIAHARAAAEAAAPASPWPEAGLRRLDTIGHDAAARGDEQTALLAYGAMRTAVLATSSPWSDREPWRTRAEDGLARVAAALTGADPTGPRVTAESMKGALERAP